MGGMETYGRYALGAAAVLGAGWGMYQWQRAGGLEAKLKAVKAEADAAVGPPDWSDGGDKNVIFRKTPDGALGKGSTGEVFLAKASVDLSVATESKWRKEASQDNF